MYIPDFDYYSPTTVEEACAILANLGSDAKVLAGGTDVLSKMKNELIPKVTCLAQEDREYERDRVRA
jgi:CO/xanthine dehydrogenase FAD-binding subunit